MTPSRKLIRAAHGRMMRRTITAGECVEYQGAIDSRGYPAIRVGRQVIRGHRLTVLAHRGRIPTGKHVLHHCDNKRCVNLDHLFIGTHADNMADLVAKGLQPRGEQVGVATLTNSQADEIRIRYFTEPTTMERLGAEYGTSATTIGRVIARRTYAA